MRARAKDALETASPSQFHSRSVCTRLALKVTMAESSQSALLFQHAQADREIEALERAVRGPGGDVPAAFDALEQSLLSHFEAEEGQLFPAYEQAVPADALTLREQHAEFRSRLAEAHKRVERGQFDARQLRDLHNALTLHHAHEETGLYRWARSRLT